MKIKFPGLKILDRYIIRKFLGTYLFAIALIVLIVIIFDYAEKIDDFITNKAPFSEIILRYYLNFIPFFINQFSGLFTFIAVIFFTSKMAYNTEIVAILSSGTSFRRLMWPYFVSALAITSLALVLNLWIIPKANESRVKFETTYISRARNAAQQYENDIYRQIDRGTYVYLRSFAGETQKASFFAIERYEGNSLVESLEAADVTYSDETGRWTAPKYTIRRMPAPDSLGVMSAEEFRQIQRLDTLINLNTVELGKVDLLITTMNIGELNRFIDEQKTKGSDMMAVFEVERQSRFSYPAAIFILTLIGVSLSSRKVRGGTGLHIGIGISLCFGYILFSRFAEEFAKGGVLPATLSVWMPNILFAVVAVWLYIKAPK
ncbi:MAG: LptF/LptG family permease [Alistipes sp.]|jgi:lipopolysaccharide export system permease protein|nr:LptF/LptG family permease [Alistipes sp.]